MLPSQINKILIIQTAFIGDVILATALVEKLISFYPNSKIDFLVRKGNETILETNPHLNQILTWDKKNCKHSSLIKLILQTRKDKYDIVINAQRFMSTALTTVISSAPIKSGFKKSPLSFFYQNKALHTIGGIHEIERNHKLIEFLTDNKTLLPKLYLTETHFEKIKQYLNNPFICIAPASVWKTKQFPTEQWIEFINKIENDYHVYLIGSKEDTELCDNIKEKTGNQVINLCGTLSILESAALMKNAVMNYVNDSAPLHICSSINAPVTAIFCSTVTDFGFAPLGKNAYVVETEEKLSCRPCGLHGKKECPEKHFKCATTVKVEQLLNALPNKL